MANFDLAFHIVIVENEGKYSNDKNDSGGETIYGLTRESDSDCEIWNIVNQYKKSSDYPNNLPFCTLLATAKNYIKKKYWDYAELDNQTSYYLALSLFDVSVNQGKNIAILFLQHALNTLSNQGKKYPIISQDGIFGSETKNALSQCKESQHLITLIRANQIYRYQTIIDKNGSQSVFADGWLNRVETESISKNQ